MNPTGSRSTIGLRLSQGALRVLREHGLFAQSSVSPEHQAPGKVLRHSWTGIRWCRGRRWALCDLCQRRRSAG
jgi:hypothetical protein